MSRKSRIARYIALVVGGLLAALGIVHDIVNIAHLRRALARGEIAERLAPQLMANVASAGLALSILGVLLILVARDLAKGKRTAWRISIVIGLYFVLVGVAAYLWLPVAGAWIFVAIGVLVCGPLLLWRKEFLVE